MSGNRSAKYGNVTFLFSSYLLVQPHFHTFHFGDYVNVLNTRHKSVLYLSGFDILESMEPPPMQSLDHANMAKSDVENHGGNKQGFVCWRVEI